jgi:ABC-type branched-subunit amino acid transport system substrate-binding protein
LMQKIHSVQGGTSARRVQNLAPLVDFDWVLLPASPREAVQIVPSFNFFDAFNVKFIGGPSWQSRLLSKQSFKHNGLYFLGDKISSVSSSFKESFKSKYGTWPRMVEIMAYDAMKVVLDILSSSDFKSRDELDIWLKNKGSIDGSTGLWKIQDNIWVKEMTPFKLRRGKVLNIFEKSSPSDSRT